MKRANYAGAFWFCLMVGFIAWSTWAVTIFNGQPAIAAFVIFGAGSVLTLVFGVLWLLEVIHDWLREHQSMKRSPEGSAEHILT